MNALERFRGLMAAKLATVEDSRTPMLERLNARNQLAIGIGTLEKYGAADPDLAPRVRAALGKPPL